MLRRLLHAFRPRSASVSSSRKKVAGCKPRVETLEGRDLMARLAVLDFDGGNLTAAQMTDGHWSNGAQNVSSFKSLFTSANPILDVNGDGQVNTTDANLAIDKIVAKVRQDYSPYDLKIVVGNLSDRPAMLTDSQVGDVMVMVTGGRNTLSTQSANGLSPWNDLGNERDEIAWVFGESCMSTMTSAEMVINSVARTISHEMAHCFGLGHITATPTGLADAHSHNLMGVELSGAAQRDYGRDFTFQDIFYQTDALGASAAMSANNPRFNTASQNSHLYLSDPAVLGPSNRPWIAMLRPGELTVTGDGGENTINVSQFFTFNAWEGWREHWAVSATAFHWIQVGNQVASESTTTTATIDIVSPGGGSLNPYDAAVTKIIVNSGGLDDTITIHANITAALWAHGGSGVDTITGGAGADHIWGDAGNDKIFGGNGGDFLYGGLGVDEIHGQNGNDFLYGDTDNTDDGVVDSLFGEAGNDTFGQKKSYLYAPVVADRFVDYNAAEDWIVRFDQMYVMYMS